MVAIMAATTMNTVTVVNLNSMPFLTSISKQKPRLIWLALVFFTGFLIIVSLQIVIVAICLHLSSLKTPSIQLPENPWLDLAESLSVSNPDIFSARSRFLRQKALLPGFKQQKTALLNEALLNLSLAVKARPFWPYYPLSELNIYVLQNANSIKIQQKVTQIIELAPNERGLDKHFLELAIHSWARLTLDQQQWMLARLNIVPYRTLSYVYDVAKRLDKGYVVCTNLPFMKVKRLCKTN
jgi:hypothetical protein